MLFSVFSLFILFYLKFDSNLSMAEEPMCSKFSCEEQLLEKMIRQEIKVEMMQNGIKKSQEAVVKTLEGIKKTDEDVGQTLDTLRGNFTELADKTTQGQEKTEEALGKMFDELQNKLTKKTEEQRKVVKRLKEEIQKTNEVVAQTLETLQNNFTDFVEKSLVNSEETLRKNFDELRKNLSKETEEQRESLTGLLENVKKPSVAFFAEDVVDIKLDKTDKIIVFTKTTTNEGSGYDNSTGIFTAPVGGLYQFIVHYCTYYKQHSPLALVMSGKVIARSSNYDAIYYTCTSFSAVIRIQSREKIWVKCLDGRSSYALFQNGWMTNYFSGILINI